VFPPRSCYLLASGLTLTGPKQISLSGGHFVEQRPGTANGRAALRVVGGSDVTISGLEVVGPDLDHSFRPRRAFEAGVELDGTSRALLTHVKVSDVYGDGVTLDPFPLGGTAKGAPVRPCRDVTVEDSTIDGAGRQGVALVSADHVLVRRVRIARVALDTIDLEADVGGEAQHDVWIDGVTLGPGNKGIFFANAGSGQAGTGRIFVEHCRMDGPQMGTAILVQAPPGWRRGPYVFWDNHLWAGSSTTAAAVELHGVAEATLWGNTIEFPRGAQAEKAMHVSASARVVAQYNSFVGARGLGARHKVSYLHNSLS